MTGLGRAEQAEPSPAELYPIHGVRFRNGRTFHSVKKPPSEDGWYDYLEAACGRKGLLPTGFALGVASRCKGCKKVFDPNTPKEN